MAALKTLGHIELVMRIHWDPHATDEYMNTTAMIGPMLEELMAMGLIESDGLRYRTTERGGVYVEAIRNLPLPVPSWSMPSD